MRVLVVDDSPENCYLLQVALWSHGHDGVCAANGADALEKLHAGSYDLILSDILMPKMDGYALCRECRSDPALKDVPIILATAAYTDEKDEVFARSIGADRFIRRPMDPEDMLAVIDEVLAQRRAGGASAIVPPEETLYFTEYSERLATQLQRKVTELEKENAMRRRIERALRIINRGNQALVHADSEKTLMEQMCRAIVDVGGFRMAWAGLTERQDGGLGVRPVAWYEPLEKEPTVWPEIAPRLAPVDAALDSGLPQVVQDIAAEERLTGWREAAMDRGYGSCATLPLVDESGPIGILVICAHEAGAFIKEEVDVLTELASDLSYGICALRVRLQRDHAMEERQLYLDQIRMKLEDTIQAIVALVETRDPYTAGHEKRVADLSAAIAHEMRLPESRIEGLRVAGSIHDVGKIRVPTEILARPGLLGLKEYSLVQIHPEVGYEILRGIDFPWPVATIVLQHHERLDGSGYPNGLKDGAILLEAQILAVADTVEAMATNRPYRASLGLDAALEDIIRKRGILYDAQVVDACVRLFREGRFSFSSANESSAPQGVQRE